MEQGTCYMTITYGEKEYNGVFCQMKDEAGTDVMTFLRQEQMRVSGALNILSKMKAKT